MACQSSRRYAGSQGPQRFKAIEAIVTEKEGLECVDRVVDLLLGKA
jgi:hypothetical protein